MQGGWQLTHGDAVNLRMVGFIVVPVEGFLPDGKRGTDGQGKRSVLCCCGQMSVDVVHGRYNNADARCVPRKKERSVFENLGEGLFPDCSTKK